MPGINCGPKNIHYTVWFRRGRPLSARQCLAPFFAPLPNFQICTPSFPFARVFLVGMGRKGRKQAHAKLPMVEARASSSKAAEGEFFLPSQSSEGIVHKPKKGDRYKIPRFEFYDDGDPAIELRAVVSELVRGHVHMWFEGGDRFTSYTRQTAEDFSDYYLHPDTSIYEEDDEDAFQALEVKAGLHKAN